MSSLIVHKGRPVAVQEAFLVYAYHGNVVAYHLPSAARTTAIAAPTTILYVTSEGVNVLRFVLYASSPIYCNLYPPYLYFILSAAKAC